MKKFAVIAAAAGMFALAACGEKPAEEAAPDAVATEAVVDDAAAGAEAAAAGAEAAAAGAEAAAGAAAITDAAVPAADVAAAAAAAEEAKK